MGVSYRQAKQLIGKPVIAYGRDGKRYAGIVDRVTHDTVWLTPITQNTSSKTKTGKKHERSTAEMDKKANTVDAIEARFPFGGFNPFGGGGGFNPFGGGGNFNPFGGGGGVPFGGGSNPMSSFLGGGGFNPFGGGGNFNPFGGSGGVPFGGGGSNPMGSFFGGGGFNPFGGGGNFNPFGGGTGGSNPLGMLFGGGSGGGMPFPLNMLLGMASKFMW